MYYRLSVLSAGRQKQMSSDVNMTDSMSGLRKAESRDSLDIIGE